LLTTCERLAAKTAQRAAAARRSNDPAVRRSIVSMSAPRRALRRLSALLADPGFCRRSAGWLSWRWLSHRERRAVRLTGSGLGCSDWPNCTATSVVAPPVSTRWFEFGNRLVNVVITLGMVLVVLASFMRRPPDDLVVLSSGLIAGILAEIVLGARPCSTSWRPSSSCPLPRGRGLARQRPRALSPGRQPDGAATGQPDGARPEPLRTGPAQEHGLLGPVPGEAGTCGRAGQLALTFVVVVWERSSLRPGRTPAPRRARFGFSCNGAQLHGRPSRYCSPSLWRPCGPCPGRVAPAVLRRGECCWCLVAQAAVGYSQYLTGTPSCSSASTWPGPRRS